MSSPLPLVLVALVLSPCGATEPSEPMHAEGGETPALASAPVVETIEPDEPDEPPPPPDPALSVALPRVHSRLTPEVVANLREIVAAGNRSEDVFAKMGGSSIESRAFLHCLAHDRNVDLGGRTELVETLEFFRNGTIPGSHGAFDRGSIAARKGWSVRHGLTGRPSRVLQEIRATSARYALVFFGGNDVQARDPMRFGERLEQLIDSVLPRGVIPVLGATTPRGDDPEMDAWARKYNRISRGIAHARGFPYVDFYLALQELPNRGLAGDGVHSNVYRDGNRHRACVFSEDGLQSGMNMRNLRTLESLHRLRQALGEGDPPDPSPDALFGAGNAEEPLRLASLPHGEYHGTVSELTSSIESYACGDEEPVERPGGDRVYRVRVEEPITIWAAALARRASVAVYLLDDELGCVSGGDDELEVELQPGVHHISVEVSPDRDDATLTVLFDTDVPS